MEPQAVVSSPRVTRATERQQGWCPLQSRYNQVTQEHAQTWGRAHEVQRYHRDAEETKDWVEEKEQNLDAEDIGNDLATVQRLQRKQEGLERDLAAFGDKVKQLDETADRLIQTHPDQAGSIYEHQKEIIERWNALTAKAENKKGKLLDSYDFQRFRDVMAWINSMIALVSSDELARDVTGT